ncbi:MAG: class I SAM-dependent methyltransferase [Patescibacteria group bacterium]
MINQLTKQYNKLAVLFSRIHDEGNKYSNRVFYNVLRANNLQGKKILDLGCGNGADIEYYKYRFGDAVTGVDASEKLLEEAKAKSLDVCLGYFDHIPFGDSAFDTVISKYAFQTSDNMSQIYEEVSRVLQPSGTFIFLVVHPFRQFFEKKSDHKNFFEKTIVQSVLFDGEVTVEEPTHTMQEYLSPEFFKRFSLQSYVEKADFHSAERIDGNEYPTYMIISATKR